MWPYTQEEWETLTYGIKKKVKKPYPLAYSAIPSVLMGIFIGYLIFGL